MRKRDILGANGSDGYLMTITAFKASLGGLGADGAGDGAWRSDVDVEGLSGRTGPG